VFDPAPGGPIGSINVEGCILETGPESWLAAKPWAEQLIREIGMGDQLTGSNDAQRRTYVLRQGRFVTLPEGLQMLVPTKILPVIATQLFGWGTKIRMGLEVFRSPQQLPDRSVAAFVQDHFGAEAVDYLAEPLLAGVYGGSPHELSAPSVLPKFVEYEQRYGSVVVGTLRDKRKPSGQSIFKSLKGGVGTLIDALVARVNVVRTPVEAIAPGWSVFSDGEWRSFDRVVLACGAARFRTAAVRSGLLAIAVKTSGIRSTRLAFWYLSRSGARSWHVPGSRPSGWGACLPIRPSSAAFRPTRTSRARHRKPNCGV
jgi:oxygen-dependent protoporphyrinogen oxidase